VAPPAAAADALASAGATPFAARVARVLRAADELERLARAAPPPARLGLATAGGHAFLPRGDRVVLGRGARCDVVVRGAHVSREHAVLLRRGDAWWLEDLDSSNGTFVGGERVLLRRLHDGDVVLLGDEPVRISIHSQ
jgi:FHA domain